MTSARRVTAAFVLALVPALAAAQDRSTPPAQSPVSVGENGFSLQSPQGDFQLRIGLLVNADGRFALGDDAARVTDTFALRRLRVPLRGRIARRFEFYANPDFGSGTVVLQDAYLDTVFSPAFRLRVGKTKTPFGLERLHSSTHMLFFERALPTALAPNRDVGIQVLGDLAGGLVSYQAGVLNGVADGSSGDVDAGDGKDVAGRVLVRPFQKRAATDPLRAVVVGFAATAGKQAGTTALPTLRTPSLQQTIFAYTGAAAAGTRTRYSPQASYVYKSFGAFAEYVQTDTSVASAAARADVAHRAWQIAGSYVLTGEAATDGSTGVRPHASFDAENGRWGALQVAARYHHLEIDEAARRFAAAGSALEAEAWTVGVNWFLTPNIRYVLNFERTVFDGNGNSARPAENALVFRSQLAF
jgi:phosphate-selective porin OprO/OprP